MTKRYNLAYLVSHPIQYQVPLLRCIAQHPEIDLTVFFMSDISVRGYQDPGFGVQVKWDVPLLEGYKHEFLPTIGGNDSISVLKPFVHGLGQRLKAGKFDAIWVHGYAHQASIRALLAAKRLGIKTLLRGESHLYSHERSSFKTWGKKRILQRLFKSIDGFLAIGSLNKEYYLHFGVPEEKIFDMPYAVDNDAFRKMASDVDDSREAFRAELGLQSDRPIILYVSKFEPRKHAGDLLEAYIKLSPDGVQEPDSYLLFIGDGEEREQLRARSDELGWTSIKFLGFKNQSELPRYYGLCDVFVLPSEYEPWGLVVNEVMNAGKAVVVSDRVGCAPDLVEDGVNGFVVSVGDIPSLTDRLRRVVGNQELSTQMGAASLKKISAWGFKEDAEGLCHALESTAAR